MRDGEPLRQRWFAALMGWWEQLLVRGQSVFDPREARAGCRQVLELAEPLLAGFEALGFPMFRRWEPFGPWLMGLVF